MSYAIFTKTTHEGSKRLRLHESMFANIDKSGYSHTVCHCCGLKVVVRPESSEITLEDMSYLDEK